MEVSKIQLERKLNHPWRSQREHPRPQTQSVAAWLFARGPVERPRHRVPKRAERAAQRIPRSIKVREIHHIEERHARLHLNFFADLVNPIQADVEGPQPAHARFVERSLLDRLLYSAQARQLLKIEHSTIDQHLTGWSRLIGKVVVVLIDERIDVARVHSVPERSDIRAGQHIPNRSVRGKEIG